jgi:predicted ArsR family transcriptional regulator
MLADTEAKNTRERVLHTLLANERCTINDLADSVDINPISVRHHISRLEAEGLVTSAEERHGVGRPRRLYFLTEKGRERFPTRYIRLTLRLLQQLKESLPQPMVAKLFSEMARDLAKEYAYEVSDLSMEERLQLVKQLLSAEGFQIEWERQGEQYLLREINCPYYHIGQNHPEVCVIDQTLIATLLGMPTTKVQCMLNGDAHCTYLLNIEHKEETQEA